jgi:GT2 family glycosyltransferase
MISIVTTCFNHAEFLEKTILSVLAQKYPDLEFIIMDGGSTDDSVDISKSPRPSPCRYSWGKSAPLAWSAAGIAGECD